METRRLEPSLESGKDYRLSEFKSLREHPKLYPGILPSHHYLYRMGRIWQLRLSPLSRISRAQVMWKDAQGLRLTSLTNLLLRWGATGVGQRIPVLAVGSNIYPRQLFDKLQDALIDDTIPSVRGIVKNLEVAFCPFVNKFGYVPVTPRYRKGARSWAWLQLLSFSQLQAIAATEKSYEFVSVPDSVAQFTVEDSQETLSMFYVFWHRRFYAVYGELPAVCEGSVAEGDADQQITRRVRSEAQILGQSSQDSLLSKAVERDPPSQVIPTEVDAKCIRYGAIVSNFPGSVDPTGLRVRSTGPVRSHKGDRETLAYVPTLIKKKLRLGQYAVVYSEIPTDVSRSRTLATLVRVIEDPRPAGRPPQVALDQLARAALGLSAGEYCHLAPLSFSWRLHIGNAVGRLFASRWLVGRAVKSTGPVLERPMCWIDRSMLAALGIDEGGYVVIAAVVPVQDSQKFAIRYRTLQALTPPSEQVQMRMNSLHPDDPDARFPDASEILGVFPDLPWVWIDEQTRSVIGLTPVDTIGPVMVRPSIGYLFLRMASRFVLATLGIGAGLAVVSKGVIATIWPETRVAGVTLADLVSVSIVGTFILVGLTVIFINARR